MWQMSGLSGGAGRQSRQGGWELRDVRLRDVLLAQDWGGLLTTWTLFAVLEILCATDAISLNQRPFVVYDASLAYQYNPDSTVPYWAVGVVGCATLLLSIGVGEFLVAAHADATAAVATSLLFLLEGVSAFALNGALTQASKQLVGRLRPDWLARCRPDVPADVAPQYDLRPADSPACHSLLSEAKQHDGHQSFPSGHASSAFVLSVYVIVYCIWCWHWRAGRAQRKAAAAPPQPRAAVRVLLSALGQAWVLGLLLWAWFVGASRITDNKHNPSDVAAGALLGTLIGALYSLRAAAGPAAAGEADGDRTLLLPGGDGSADGAAPSARP